MTADRSPPGLANHRRGFAGDRRLVDRGDALDNLAVAGDDFAGRHQHDVATQQLRRRHPFDGVAVDDAIGQRVRLGAPQTVGLRLAPSLGHRLGEVGEQHGQPQPRHDLPLEQQIAAAGGRIDDEACLTTSTAPTSTTNMTGLRAIVSGFSFRNASSSARRTSARSQIEAADDRVCRHGSERLSLMQEQVFDDRTEADCRERRSARRRSR